MLQTRTAGGGKNMLQTNLFLLVCKPKKSDHIHPILETLHWLPVTHHYLLQFHFWNGPSVSVRSSSTLYSSKMIMIRIRHMSLCHPLCKHKNIWWKIVFLHWPICLEQFASWKAFYCADFDFCKRCLYPQEGGWRGVGWESTHWNPFEMSSFKRSSFKINSFNMNTFKMNFFKMNSFKMSPFKMSSFKMNSNKMNSFKMNSLKLNTFKMSSFKMNTFKLSSFKMNTFKMNSFKMNTFKMNSCSKKSLDPQILAIVALCHKCVSLLLREIPLREMGCWRF